MTAPHPRASRRSTRLLTCSSSHNNSSADEFIDSVAIDIQRGNDRTSASGPARAKRRW